MFAITGMMGKTHRIRVTVKFFASYREAIDEDEEVLEVPGGSSVKRLRALVTAAHPRLQAVEAAMLTSVNEAFVDDEVELQEGDVVAFFPPLSGG
jgi:molybdopterin synthase sulfur carrier subunit